MKRSIPTGLLFALLALQAPATFAAPAVQAKTAGFARCRPPCRRRATSR